MVQVHRDDDARRPVGAAERPEATAVLEREGGGRVVEGVRKVGKAEDGEE